MRYQELPSITFDVIEYQFSLHDRTERFEAALPLNINIVDNDNFNILVLKCVIRRHP